MKTSRGVGTRGMEARGRGHPLKRKLLEMWFFTKYRKDEKPRER